MTILEQILPNQAKNNSFASESDYDILRIHPRKLALIWPQCHRLLMKGMGANPLLSIDELVAGLADQSFQFWIIVPVGGSEVAAVFLTAIERDRGEWVLSLFNLGGSGARQWVMDVHRSMHRYARIEGCTRVRLCGRPAWQRLLPNYPVVGERHGHLIYEQPVGE